MNLRIGGLTTHSTVDYPGMLAAVVFCQGCCWQCKHCHNPELRSPSMATAVDWTSVLELLHKRRGLLDAVVFSGGEPLLQCSLVDAMTEVKALGFKVGLHTGGCCPERLARVLPVIDWIGFDIKAPEWLHHLVTGVPGSGDNAWECVRMIARSGIDCEFRVTVYPEVVTSRDLDVIRMSLRDLGVTILNIQQLTNRQDKWQQQSIR